MQFVTRENHFWKFLGCKGKQLERFEYNSGSRYLHPSGLSWTPAQSTCGWLGGFHAQIQFCLMLSKASNLRYIWRCGTGQGVGQNTWKSTGGETREGGCLSDSPLCNSVSQLSSNQEVLALSGLPSAGLGKWIPCVWFQTMRFKNNFFFSETPCVETGLKIEDW